MELLYVIYFLSTLKLIIISQSHMFSCLMELRTYSLLVEFSKFIIQRFQLCMDFNTLYPFLMIFLQSQF